MSLLYMILLQYFIHFLKKLKLLHPNLHQQQNMFLPGIKIKNHILEMKKNGIRQNKIASTIGVIFSKQFSLLKSFINDVIDDNDFEDKYTFQIDEFDNLKEYFTDSRFIIIDIPYDKSKGACWARNLIQQYYSGQDYTLQIDSHMRFVERWDEKCIEMVKQLQKNGYKKTNLRRLSHNE